MPVNVEDTSNMFPARNEVDSGPGIRCNRPPFDFERKSTKARTATANATNKDTIFVRLNRTENKAAL